MNKSANLKTDLIERYVQEVVKRVPTKQRADIDMELRSLIDDELSMQDQVTVEEVLLKLGNPRLLADNYLNHKRYLIGPAYIDLYVMLLKIVIPSVMLALTIALTVAFVASTDQNGIEFILSLLGTWWSAALQVFAFITVGFAIAEYMSGGKMKEEPWHPNMLPEKKELNKQVKVKEAIGGIVFAVIGMIIFNITPNLIAIYQFDGTMIRIPLLNQQIYPTILLWINIGFILAIIKEAIKIIFGTYTIKLVIVESMIGLLGVIAVIVLLSMMNLINPTINADLAAAGIPFDINVYQWLNRIKTIIMIVVIVAYVAEVATMISNQVQLKRKAVK
jgi:hypothetical protein